MMPESPAAAERRSAGKEAVRGLRPSSRETAPSQKARRGPASRDAAGQELELSEHTMALVGGDDQR